jgi:hypothetical protein
MAASSQIRRFIGGFVFIILLAYALDFPDTSRHLIITLAIATLFGLATLAEKQK